MEYVSNLSESGEIIPSTIHLEWKTKGSSQYCSREGKKCDNILEYNINTGKDSEYSVKAATRDRRLFGSMEPHVLKSRGPSVVTTYIEENYETLLNQIKLSGKVKEQSYTEMLNDIWYSWYQKEAFGAGFIESDEFDSSDKKETDPSKVVYKYIDKYSKNGLYAINSDDLVERLPGGIEVLHIREDDSEDRNYDSEGKLFNKASFDKEVEENPLNIVIEEDALEEAMLDIIHRTAYCMIPGSMILGNCGMLLKEMTVDLKVDNLVTDKYITLVRKTIFSDYDLDRNIQNEFALVFKTVAKNPDLYKKVYSRVINRQSI